MKQMIDFLLANASPSIVLRTRRDILHNLTAADEETLQREILAEKIPQHIAAHQQPSGWIGLGFHGSSKRAGQYDNQETAVKFMGEKGLQGTPLLDGAVAAFTTTPLTDPIYETGGRLYSEFEIPAFGQGIIRAACIARAGYAAEVDITPQIGVALESFRRVTEVDSILDVSRPGKKCRLFNAGERWPCRYHLEILAFTDSWRTPANIAMLAEAFTRLMRTDRPEITQTPVACWVGHAVGPLWYLNEGWSISTGATNQPAPDGVRHINLEKVEWLCRCGLYPHLPALREEVDFMAAHIADGVCRVPFYENEFRGWGPYAGLQLEPDWRKSIRRDCDVTFRAAMILHLTQ